MKRHLTIPEFARETGLPVAEIKRRYVDGLIPYRTGRPLGRDVSGQMIYAPLLQASEVQKHVARDAPAHDPGIKRNAVLQASAAKRALAVRVEAREPDALMQEAVNAINDLDERQRDALRRRQAAIQEREE